MLGSFAGRKKSVLDVKNTVWSVLRVKKCPKKPYVVVFV